jgi:hypothetical protein
LPVSLGHRDRIDTMMSDQVYPAGWDEERVRKVLAFYDTQTEDEALIEDEAAME